MTSSGEEGEDSQCELWRVQRGTRVLRGVVRPSPSPPGFDVRISEGADTLATQFCHDAATALTLCGAWQEALLAVGWLDTTKPDRNH
jgi:hypothetical protein